MLTSDIRKMMEECKPVYKFDECNKGNEPYKEKANTLIKEFFGAEEITPANNAQADYNGTDFVITNSKGLRQTIDVKYMNTPLYEENKIIIEVDHINIDGTFRRLGWSFQQDKNTDWIVYYFRKANKIRVIPFLLLRKICIIKKDLWITKYTTGGARNPGYTTRCIFLPVSEYIDAEKEILIVEPVVQTCAKPVSVKANLPEQKYEPKAEKITWDDTIYGVIT